ncbi:MAG: hypothetical protein ACOZCO_05750 [Bacteroidota bacterium]
MVSYYGKILCVAVGLLGAPYENMEVYQAKEKDSWKEWPCNGGNGICKIYDRYNKLLQTGEFKNGRLWTGEWIKYQTSGLVERIEIYKYGKYMGYRLME